MKMSILFCYSLHSASGNTQFAEDDAEFGDSLLYSSDIIEFTLSPNFSQIYGINDKQSR